MGKLLRFLIPKSLWQFAGISSDGKHEYQMHLSDYLSSVGVEMLNRRGSFRCRVCNDRWRGIAESGTLFEDWWQCPNGCNANQ